MNLPDLKVQSFVTELGGKTAKTAKGGSSYDSIVLCQVTVDPPCMPSGECRNLSQWPIECLPPDEDPRSEK